MAGIYFHIPYCKQACHYCDFHFSTNIKSRNQMVSAMVSEIELRKDFISDQKINTVYFGGGTPSLFNNEELSLLLQRVRNTFQVDNEAEITLEANPDDLTEAKLNDFARLGINRLSIGIQSFYQEHLKWMNRAHNSTQAIECIQLSKQCGFINISADLIYGFPGLTNEQLLSNISRLVDAEIPHISAYSLTVEPKTALDNFIKKGSYSSIDEKQAVSQFLLLSKTLQTFGYEHYEVSNFAKPNCRSKHNSAYWSGTSYLGIGPGAHSYNGNERSWNIKNNQLYIKELQLGEFNPEVELLSKQTKYNEYLLTRFRTAKGINLKEIEDEFGVNLKEQFASELKKSLNRDEIIEKAPYLRLTKTGLLWADNVAANFFIVDDENNF